MADLGFFDANTAKQIVEHVAADRRGVQGSGPNATGAKAISGILLAKITDGDSGKYSWIAQKVGEDGTLTDYEDWGSGDYETEKGYARELTGAEEIPWGTIVRLWPSNYQPFYLFTVADWLGELKEDLEEGGEADCYVLTQTSSWTRVKDSSNTDVCVKVAAAPWQDGTYGAGESGLVRVISGTNVFTPTRFKAVKVITTTTTLNATGVSGDSTQQHSDPANTSSYMITITNPYATSLAAGKYVCGYAGADTWLVVGGDCEED